LFYGLYYCFVIFFLCPYYDALTPSAIMTTNTVFYWLILFNGNDASFHYGYVIFPRFKGILCYEALTFQCIINHCIKFYDTLYQTLALVLRIFM